MLPSIPDYSKNLTESGPGSIRAALLVNANAIVVSSGVMAFVLSVHLTHPHDTRAPS